jgi:prolipoprotein diacylglyceryl transferase
MLKRFIASPSISGFSFGPFHIHFYAICIVAGTAMAIALSVFRYKKIGGDSEEIYELALWLIPSGIIGGRIYHLITSPDTYFGKDGHPWNAFAVWNGGLGIWGAIALGGVVAYFVFTKKIYIRENHNKTITFAHLADVLAPGVIFAQSIGRWGNWFNKELYGSPTKAWWGLEIPPAFRMPGYENYATFHPTFLYESIWCAVGGLLLVTLTISLSKYPGSLFTLYVAFYTTGRTFIEMLRIDTAHKIGGVRINVWVAILVALCAWILFFVQINSKSIKNNSIGDR